MSVVKKSVAIDEDIAREVADATQGQSEGFSPMLAEAVAKYLKIRNGLRTMREWDEEDGPLTPEEKRAGRAERNRLLARAAEISQ